MQYIGLRIDVDTLRGTRKGVPNLVRLLEKYGIKATFFFSVGPDNMGRHLWRLLRPSFLNKMLRTKAASLYGWDILLRGTIWPGPVIGKYCSGQIFQAANGGHETGLHAWDHHRWQKTIDRMDETAAYNEIRKGYDLLKKILKKNPECFAAPAWRVTPEALHALARFPFRFESDCRGHSIFNPLLYNGGACHIQVPTTMPTYDELIGKKCTAQTFNKYLLTRVRQGELNVLTIHAESEGISNLELFEAFLNRSKQQEITFIPLGKLISKTQNVERAKIIQRETSGREGWISYQNNVYPGL